MVVHRDPSGRYGTNTLYTMDKSTQKNGIFITISAFAWQFIAALTEVYFRCRDLHCNNRMPYDVAIIIMCLGLLAMIVIMGIALCSRTKKHVVLWGLVTCTMLVLNSFLLPLVIQRCQNMSKYFVYVIGFLVSIFLQIICLILVLCGMRHLKTEDRVTKVIIDPDSDIAEIVKNIK